MPQAKATSSSPVDGSTPIALPTQDACCQVPCDPPWRIKPTCITFTEVKTTVVDVGRGKPGAVALDVAQVIISVIYAHTLCLIGKQHGGLAYTLTLLPGETMTLYQSDRYRRTTTDTERYSVQSTFSQFVSALYQQQNASDSSLLSQVLNNQTQSSSASGGGGINLGLFSIGASGGSSGSSSSSTGLDLSLQTSASQFLSVAQQASQYTDLQRSMTVSSYEDSETVSTTKRVLTNNNRCYAVNYFVRKVVDVYVSSTKVVAVTFQLRSGNFTSPVLTPAQVAELEADYQSALAPILKTLPKVGETVEHPSILAIPTDGVVYDPELAHCCAQDPVLEKADLIRLERDQAEAQKVGLEIQLMALEVQRRQALLAAGTLTAFNTPPETTVVA